MVFNLDELFLNMPMDQKKPDEEAWREKGLRLAKEKQFDQAIEAFTRYVEDEPETFFGFNAIAVCYKNTGDHSMAMKNFERALEFADSAEERAKVLANIGNLYFSTNKLQAALGYYKEAAAEFEKNPLYLILIARTFMMLEEPERAAKVLSAAEENRGGLEKYEREDDRGLGYYLMAHCYVGLGQEEKVLNYVELAMKANPDKYVRRIEKEAQDQQHLFYTLRDDATLKQLVEKYAVKMSPSSWIDHS